MSVTELAEIKEILNNLVAASQSGSAYPAICADHLRELEIRLRRMRNDVLPAQYFSDFAWDILLELDQAARNGRRYVISDAGAGAGIPLTTTVRYVAKMEKDGYLVREPDPNDRRRTFISLTPKGVEALDSIFERAVETFSIAQ